MRKSKIESGKSKMNTVTVIRKIIADELKWTYFDQLNNKVK